jgi:hypothetical protein
MLTLRGELERVVQNSFEHTATLRPRRGPPSLQAIASPRQLVGLCEDVMLLGGRGVEFPGFRDAETA